MTFTKLSVAIGCVATALLALLPLSAMAALGGDAAAMPAEQNGKQVMRRATVSNGYTVHERQSDSGVTVREYASAQGKIFAVSWQGPFLPDLEQLLGAYFPSFKAAAAARRAAGARGPVSIQQDDLVVQSSGHMRAFSGRAYVPSLLPPQVSIDEIQ